MNVLKQSTAVTIKLGPFVDATNGVTAEDALTITQADVRLSKNGGDIAQKSESASATHDELGYYDIALDTTDTNTVGTLRVMVSESGALPVFRDFQVIEEAVYDALFAASAVGPLLATSTGSGFSAIPWNASWDTEVQSECTDALNAYDPPTRAELTSDINSLNDLDAAGIRTAVGLATANLDTQLNAIVTDTAEIGAAGAGLTALPWNAAWDAEVQSEVADGLNAYFPTLNANMATVVSQTAATSIRTAVGLASANLDTQLGNIVTDTAEIGAAGSGLTAIPWNASWDAEVQSECTDAITAAAVLKADTAYDVTTVNGTLATTFAS